MPFVITSSYPVSSTSTMSTTVQTIINSVSQDIRSVLGSSGSDANILMDYCNRVNLELLRASRWEWLRSAPKYFITKKGRTDYWVGATGSAPQGAVDTGLNITDMNVVLENTVYDRSNYKPLMRATTAPLVTTIVNQDGKTELRLGRPGQWRQDTVNNPNLIQIFPAADNQNTFSPQPQAPNCVTTAGGALAARTYYVRTTLVDNAGGESAASDEAVIFCPANTFLTVKSPNNPLFLTTDTGVTYTSYKVYASTSSNTETLQSTNTLGVDWTETAVTPSATAYPTTSTIAAMGGYLIEFCYQKAATQLTSLGQIVQCPDAYKDVFIAGVNAYTAEYLKLPRESGVWFSIYNTGVRGMVRSRNLQPHADFLRPDGSAKL